MHELDRRVGQLRLLLADLSARRDQTEDSKVQLRAQIARLADFTVRRNGMVGNALAGMADIEERLARADVDLRHIELLRQQAQAELDALLVTRGIAEARARMDELGRRASALRSVAESEPGTVPGEAPASAAELAEIDAEMVALRMTIEVASDTAARSLSARARPPD